VLKLKKLITFVAKYTFCDKLKIKKRSNFMNFYDAPPPLSNYLNYLKSIKGKSKNTINEYFYDLRLFYRYFLGTSQKINFEDFEEINISESSEDFLKNLKIQDLHSYITYLDEYRKINNKTKSRKIASIKSFFKYLHSVIEVIDSNPTLKLESPKSSVRHPVYLDLEKARRLLNNIEGRNKIRDEAIIMVFLNCGVRLSELVSIDISKISGDNLTVIGKGNKERTVYLNDVTKKSIDKYLEKRPKALRGHEDALFLSNRKKRISPKAVQHLVEKHLKNAGLDTDKYSPHKLRHTAATLMYQYGDVDIRALQSILGHENIATTQIYTHVNEERLKKAVDKNPLNDLDK
jgi:site-specific recombinase XerD